MATCRFLLLIFALSAAASAQPVDFNRRIRPILSDKCFTCHGPDSGKRKTALRFDQEKSAKSALANGKFAIVAGHPEQSELITRVTTANKALRMPPAYMGKDALSAAEIALLRRWVEQGAEWKPFWSFIPPVRPEVPAGQNAIDYFIQSRLAREGLRGSPEADRATLLRRVSFDITGLPPTLAELDAFLRDESPNAYEKAVDRLLASPAYGERMAFRWMEAARYGDTNGYQTDGGRDMWRWRDWVLQAFNRNMPYDQFVREQLAGDLLPNATLEQKIATGFNRNHRTNGEGGIIAEEYRVEYVADRAQTTATVFLGLTAGCARCHDHKYDPISQKEFYQLFAYFNQIPNEQGFAWNHGNEDPNVKAPLPEQSTRLTALDEILKRAEEHWKKVSGAAEKPVAEDWTVTHDLVFQKAEEIQKPFEQKDGNIADFGYMQPCTYSVWVKPEALDGGVLSHSDDFYDGNGHGIYLDGGKVRFHLIHRFSDLGIRLKTTQAVIKKGVWQHIAVTYDGRRKAAGIHIYVDGVLQENDVEFDQNNEPLNVKGRPIRLGAAGGRLYNGALRDARIYKAALTPLEVQALLPAGSKARAELALRERGPQELRDAWAALVQAQAERDKYYASIPSVMVMADGAGRATYLLKRGAYDVPGEKVEAGVPAVLGAVDPAWPKNRLGLAQWMTSRRNPLLARVMVNRVWQSIFGTGLVKTAEDFGSQGEWPVHPEVLDWLAVDFMDSGWDLKAVVKKIVMSSTYRQSSRVTPELLQKDPENRLLARGSRYRLGPEMIRDQALAVSGLLVQKVGGPSVKPYQPPGLWQELAGGGGYVVDKGEGLYRRSLYTYWKRTAPPPYMVNFDSPNREVCTVAEGRTNSPLQSLNLMNDVAFLEASRKFAERVLTDGGGSMEYAYRLATGRLLDEARKRVLERALQSFRATYTNDRKAAASYLAQGDSPVNPALDAGEFATWTAVSNLLLNSDEVITKQ